MTKTTSSQSLIPASRNMNKHDQKNMKNVQLIKTPKNDTTYANLELK